MYVGDELMTMNFIQMRIIFYIKECHIFNIGHEVIKEFKIIFLIGYMSYQIAIIIAILL